MADLPGNDPRKMLAASKAEQPPPKPAAPRRPPAATKPAPVVDAEPIPPSRLRELAPWASLLVIGVMGAAASAFVFLQEATTLAHGATNPARIQDEWVQSDWPDFLEVTAEQSLRTSPADEGAAYLAAKKAVALDPSRASAWAVLAYVEARQAGGINQPALDALGRSMAACPLCDQALIRWRFNFVLSNWNQIPDDMRRKAFEQADILRWVGQNAEFLAEMRYKAGLVGIPFDAYRTAVDTPARSWDISPAAQLRGSLNTPG